MVRRVSRQVNAGLKRCLCKHHFSDFREYHSKKDRFAAHVNHKGRLFKEKLRSYFPSKPKHPDMFGFASWISSKIAVPRGRFLLRYCGGWASYVHEKRRYCAACSRQVPPPPPSIYYSSDEDEDDEDDDDEDDEEDGASSASTSSRDTNSAEEAMKSSDDDYSHPSSQSPTPPSPPSSNGSDGSVSSYRSR